jgi:hypothetical protein
MMLILNRDYFTTYAILGRLTEPQSGRGWDTIERPWIPTSYGPCGMKGLSCLPLGDYRVERYNSDAHPSVYALSAPALGVFVTEQQVPPSQAAFARTRTLIHPANWASELRGCVAPGKTRARGPGGIWQVTQSRDAMNEIRNVLGRSAEITLSITSGGLQTAQ